VKGCVFHFTKALNTKKDHLGLQTTYKDIDYVNDWMRQVHGAVLLPLYLVRPFLLHLLQTGVPDVFNARLNIALGEFAMYVINQWLPPGMIALWNQHGNDGPRTTNHAEGYHSGLRFRFKHHHPRLGEFAHYLQKAQNSYGRAIRNIRAGVAFPKERRQVDIQVDENIITAQQELAGYLHAVGPNVDHFVLVRYVRRFASLLGHPRTMPLTL
jgi:hypothetical protein